MGGCRVDLTASRMCWCKYATVGPTFKAPIKHISECKEGQQGREWGREGREGARDRNGAHQIPSVCDQLLLRTAIRHQEKKRLKGHIPHREREKQGK